MFMARTGSVVLSVRSLQTNSNLSGRVVFVRHGESIWNRPPVRFTGWANVPLTDAGRAQAKETGLTLKMFGIRPDVAITSLLRRSKDSLDEMIKADVWLRDLTIINSWRMNERHYGSLVGLSKEEAADSMGEQLVTEWRKSWDVAPPPLVCEDLYAYKEAPWAQPFTIVTEPNKGSYTVKEEGVFMPLTESVRDCCDRVLPLWKEAILPRISLGQTVLIVAHANSIRAMVKHIDNIPDNYFRKINIPSAMPLVYDFAGHQPIGKPNRYGMRGRYVASKELMLSLRIALRGDNENDESFMSLLDDSILNALAMDPRSSHADAKGGFVVGAKSSVVRAHYAKTLFDEPRADVP